MSIIWYDSKGKEIGTGRSIKGIEYSTELYYSVSLDEGLGRVYREVRMQKVVATGEPLTCQLEKIDHVMLEGRVLATDIDKKSMTVIVKQMLNGKWEQIYTTQTDEQGVFTAEVYDDETDINISSDGYLDATLHRDGIGGNGNVGTIPMSLISGFAIAADITMQKAIAEGDTEETAAWTEGLNNIEFTLINETKGTAITDFTVQNGNVIIRTGAGVGDNISLIAKSKQGVFADATTTFTIAEGDNAFVLQLTELGGFNATCAVSNNGSTSGYLYNSDGLLVAKGSYVGEILSLRHLKNGVYTLISMGNSTLLGSMTSLSDISAVGLTAGSGYVSTRVEVVDGELTAVNVSEVPRLDETQFYYTNNNTYFSAIKASVTAGNYLTLQAHIDFKPEYEGKADGATLTINLPEGCEMVENSVIVNRQPVPHSINGNCVTMTLNKELLGSQVRFGIIPTLNKSYTISAMASFDIDGQVTQPIGIAQFEAKGLSLSTMDKTFNPNITVNGTAKGHSEVSIYDNDVFIGKTSSKADGSWTAQCELYKPYSHSFNDIYAKIVTENGMELTSETRQVEYDKHNPVPKKVTMTYYNGWYTENKTVEFDLLNGTTSPTAWPFYSATDFTFLAEFTHNDSTVIKNVKIKVLNSDGTVRTLPTTFDGKQNKWVATTMYSYSSRLPQNVTVEYDLLPMEMSDDERNELIIDQATIMSNIANRINQFYTDKAEVTLVEDGEETVLFDCKYDDTTKRRMKIENVDYSEVLQMMNEVQFIYTETNEGITATYTMENENEITVVAVDLDEKMAFRISLTDNYHEGNDDKPDGTRSLSMPFKAPINILPHITNMFTGGARGLLEIMGALEYLNVRSDIDNMKNIIINYNDAYNKMRSRTSKLLLAKCSDGNTRLSPLQIKLFDIDKQSLSKSEDDFTEKYYQYIEEYQRRLLMSVLTDLVTMGVGNRIDAALHSSKFVCRGALNTWFRKQFTGSVDYLASSNTIANTLGIVFDRTVNGVKDVLQFADFNTTRDNLLLWAQQENMKITSGYVNLQKDIEKAYRKCPEDKEQKNENEEEKKDEPIDDKSDNNPEFRGNGSTALIDPSGFVYEAVLTNRLEGVTTTCYQQENGSVVVWNAEDYSQQNPLKTDKTGFYRWDVPQGLWQVKYEKEGYETAYSDWLPVPPPQLDVNIGMKQSTPPTVKQMHGYESGITIELSKYMRPETMTTEKITVTRNGSVEVGSIELMNAEQAPLADETYVSKVKFVPENRFNSTDLVVVTVHKEVESYCGVQMTADHIETVKIESEVKSIVADSLVTVPYNGERELRVLILPTDASAGRTLKVKTSSAMIASLSAEEVTIGQDGTATLTLGGELPGGVILNFSVDGTDVKATSRVKVVMGREMVATPEANIGSGVTISGGTQIELTCETDNSTIYYTLDGSCPCDEATRHKYEGPITIATDVIVKAIAVKDGMDDSDIATFVYIVDGIDGNSYNHRFDAIYQDGSIVVTGAKGASCHIYDLQGREMATRLHLNNETTINVLKTEVYVVCVTYGDGQTLVRKVVRKQ